jgi:hypothetical protein
MIFLIYPLGKIWVRQLGWLFPIWKNNKCSKPPTSIYIHSNQYIYIYYIYVYICTITIGYPICEYYPRNSIDYPIPWRTRCRHGPAATGGPRLRRGGVGTLGGSGPSTSRSQAQSASQRTTGTGVYLEKVHGDTLGYVYIYISMYMYRYMYIYYTYDT